jgi:hypothetical protein
MANGFSRVWNPWQPEIFPAAPRVDATGPQDDAGEGGWRCQSLVLKVDRPFRRCFGSLESLRFEPIAVALFANQNLTHRLCALGATVFLVWRSRVRGEQFVAPRSMAARFFSSAWLAIAHARSRDRRFVHGLGRHGDRFDRAWLGRGWQVHDRPASVARPERFQSTPPNSSGCNDVPGGSVARTPTGGRCGAAVAASAAPSSAASAVRWRQLGPRRTRTPR